MKPRKASFVQLYWICSRFDQWKRTQQNCSNFHDHHLNQYFCHLKWLTLNFKLNKMANNKMSMFTRLKVLMKWLVKLSLLSWAYFTCCRYLFTVRLLLETKREKREKSQSIDRFRGYDLHDNSKLFLMMIMMMYLQDQSWVSLSS